MRRILGKNCRVNPKNVTTHFLLDMGNQAIALVTVFPDMSMLTENAAKKTTVSA